MKKSLVIIGLFMCITAWYSCTKDKATVQVAAVCDSTHISYTKTIQPIMDHYCTSCHNPTYGAGANDLTNYQAVKAGVEDNSSANSIICRSTPGQSCGQDLMPQGSRNGLAQVYRDTLALWKSGGYCN